MTRTARTLSIAACGLLASSLAALAPPRGAQTSPPAPTRSAESDPYELGIFLAVLEGLYADGASTADVERVLSTPEGGGWYLHFVSACPICEPARRAFETYRARLVHRAKTGEELAFGPGLPPEIARRLASDDVDVRDAGVQAMVQRYLARWIVEHRLGEEERTDWTRALEERRKKGLMTLQTQQEGGAGLYPPWKKGCAICDGANDALGSR